LTLKFKKTIPITKKINFGIYKNAFGLSNDTFLRSILFRRFSLITYYLSKYKLRALQAEKVKQQMIEKLNAKNKSFKT
jgi:hypothetical protein